VWEWIQQVRPLHPSLDLWRPTAESPQEAEQSPPITQDYLLQYIRDAQTTSRYPDFGLTPAFSGQINQGNKLMLSFNRPASGDAGIVLMIGEELGAALDASEDLADTLMHTTANIFTPGIIGTLTRKERPRPPTPATTTPPAGNGAIFTFGTPDTYPTILNQW